MKALVFLLVLGNLLFYAFSAGYFGTPDNPDAGRAAQQVKPDSIRIVSRGEPPAAAAPVAAPVTVDPAPAEEKPAEPTADATAPASVDGSFCLAWPGLRAVEANRLGDLVALGFDGVRLSRQGGGDGNGWWVHIPPLADKAAADKKAGELRAFGVDDYFVVLDGPNRHAISLGVFSTEKGAQERLTALKARGIRSARLGLRPDKDGTISLELHGPGDKQAALEAAVARALPGRSGQDCR